ncbi:RAMP superfamily CRISPR-associated protein [Phytoactinopolyspora limicola]|uniref:RAMP superfamily CRISPR-associated protein n=1 Tax=Phytoactinopolyspora limicola TaxID=2715536 RepID=UPI00140DD151|nr:RAMP superfamily CRISPR-associated protein [Phytoactinopolyspora limicola]
MIIRLATVHLRLQEPAAISPVVGIEGTLELPRDNGGRVIIPETSIAGSLRSHLADDARRLMGYVERSGDTNNAGRTVAVSSRVRIMGCRADAGTVIKRTSTAVDPASGAARSRTLRTNELLPPGTTLAVYLRIDSNNRQADEQDWNVLYGKLHTWSPSLGGGASRGWGATTVEAVQTGTLDLTRDEDLLIWLTYGGTSLVDHVVSDVELTTSPLSGHSAVATWRKTATFSLASGLHIGSGQHKEGDSGRTPAEPMRVDHNTDQFVIPGSTWKGIFRSRMAEILGRLGAGCRRFIDAEPAPAKDAGCSPTTPCEFCLAFGVTYTEPVQLRPEVPSVVGRRGLLRFSDSVIDAAKDTCVTHVAIDRFSGGGHDRRLFTKRIVTEGRLALTITAPHAPAPGVTALLDAVIRDIDAGLVGLGHGTTRGLGSLRLTDETNVGSWDTIRRSLRTSVAEVS